MISAASVPLAEAYTYEDGNLLLIFRKPGFNDVEFNLGDVSTLTALPEGTERVITGWDLPLVQTQYDLTDDVRFLLIATTPSDAVNRSSWLTSADPGVAAVDRTQAQWRLLWARINAVGTRPIGTFGIPNTTNSYVISPDHPSSFSFVTSNGGLQPGLIPRLGDDSKFVVEQKIPGTSVFYAIKPSTVNPKPAATRVGSFEFTADGVLKFTAGSGVVVPPLESTEITGITSNDGKARITFKTKSGIRYRLRVSPDLATAKDSWTLVAGEVTGDGAEASIEFPSPEGTAQFYSVESFR